VREIYEVELLELRGLVPEVCGSFEILEGVAVGSPPTIMADNYESAVKLLNDFASAGSVGSSLEQKQDKRAKRGQHPPKQTKPQPQ